jgi:hypothetical protein
MCALVSFGAALGAPLTRVKLNDLSHRSKRK